MIKNILVIGITGSIGAAFAARCQKNGWHIKALHRNPDKAKSVRPELAGIEWIRGDAMDREAVLAAAKGIDIIFHGANPPQYKKWRQLAIPMLQNSIDAAIAAKARLVFPGNVYNFGPDAGALINENSPQNPVTKKGQVRVEMEEMLRKATNKGACAFIIRAGDFFGPDVAGSWFDQAIVKPGKKVTSVTYPGRRDVGHAWAYVPDLAETMVKLVEHEDALEPFEAFHFDGHYFPEGVAIARETLKAAGAKDVEIRNMPWRLLQLASPFVPLLRELLEMRYLWNIDLKLDNARLVAFLGEEPHTPIDEALTKTLTSLKCL